MQQQGRKLWIHKSCLHRFTKREETVSFRKDINVHKEGNCQGTATRINISFAFTRWRQQNERKNWKTDNDVANHLLNW